VEHRRLEVPDADTVLEEPIVHGLPRKLNESLVAVRPREQDGEMLISNTITGARAGEGGE
jgi:hypothetical protein